MDLVSGSMPSDLDARLAIVVANARACEGLSAGRPETRQDFEDLLGPPSQGSKWDLDRPFHWDKTTGITTGVSTCAIVARGIYARSGIAIPSWGKPYDPTAKGNALVELEQLAWDHGAWHKGAAGGPPEPGSRWVTTSYGGHTGIVIDRDGDSITSIEGGQTDSARGGLQCIKRIVRVWPSMPVWGWDDARKLPWLDRFEAPAGFGAETDPKGVPVWGFWHWLLRWFSPGAAGRGCRGA